jgi:hypothetical protein
MSVSAVPCGSAASKDNRVALLSFLADAARIYGRVCAAVIGAGLMIAAIATAEELPLSPPPHDYKGLDDLLTVIPVTRPTALHDR